MYLELLSNQLKYEVRLWDHFEWESRQTFRQLVDNFLTRKITMDQYIRELFEIERKI